MLSDLNDEADALMNETLDFYNDGLIDEDDLSILGLMIQRFYNVSANRQRWLDTNGNNESRLRVICVAQEDRQAGDRALGPGQSIRER